MKYNVELLVRDDTDSVVELHFVNVDYEKLQGTLFIYSGKYIDDRTTICGFKEERVEFFSAKLVVESKNE